jgi:excisionase family DNA binding protein
MLCMQQAGDGAAEWVPIREAAQACGVPLRTVYALVERNEVASRKVGRVSRVNLDDVRRAAATRAGASPGRHVADSPAITAARERVAAMHLAAQEAQSAVAVERHRQELADAEAERERKRVLLELEVQRARFGLLRDRSEYQREEQERQSRLRQAEHERAIDLRRQERQRAAERVATERKTWEEHWLAWATQWADEQTGTLCGRDEVLPLVRSSLRGLDPSHADSLIKPILLRALDLRFHSEIVERERQLLADAREQVARQATRIIAGFGEPFELVLPIALAAAALVDPHTLAGKVAICLVARSGYERVCNEPDLAERLRRYIGQRS